MIQKIYISNYAIIEKLEINFSNGFNVITGETGAGKSILLGALGLIMGNRADTKVLFDPSKKSVVEAVFNVSNYNLQPFFEEHDLDYDNEVIIRREINSNGSSRAFVNDTPVKLNILKPLGNSLIDMHRQFDMLDIHNHSFQLGMLDALADNNQKINTFKNGYKNYTSQIKELTSLKAQKVSKENEMDFIRFQLSELHEIVLDPLLITKNENTLQILNNAEEIKSVCFSTNEQIIDNEQSILNQLTDISIAIKQISKFDGDINNLYERTLESIEELRDISTTLAEKGEQTEYNQDEILLLQEQLDHVYRLQQKHHANDIEALIETQTELENKLGSFEDLDSNITALEISIANMEKSLHHEAKSISKRRKDTCVNYEKSVMGLLEDLGMPHSKFKVEISTSNSLNESGIDQIQYLFSANKGHQLQPLKDVASGGEISRLTLSIKSIVAKSMSLATLIYDEIDTGISGDVANKMASILKNLATDHQIINITHSPQIASKGEKHFFIYKEVVGNHTKTKMRSLEMDERIQEIAKMLSGNPPSSSAIENAKDMLSTETI